MVTPSPADRARWRALSPVPSLKYFLDETMMALPALLDAVERLEKGARELLDAYDQCDSNRGAFSCVKPHDLRCPTSRQIAGDCECGREQLDAALAALCALVEEEKKG